MGLRLSDTDYMFLNEVSKTTLLTLDEEAELTRRCRDGDKVAQNKLVTANLRFVISQAKKFQGLGLELGDLISEGCIGMIKAAERFDPTKGFKFISYAVWWVRQAILESLSKNARVVRLPLNVIGQLSKLQKEMEYNYSHQLEGQPLSPDLQKSKHELLVADLKTYSLNQPFLTCSMPFQETSEMINFIVDDEWEAKFLDTEDQREAEKLEVLEAIKPYVSERNFEILKLFYGFGEEPPRTLEQIGHRYNLSRERVRQIIKGSIRRLKFNMNGELEELRT